MERTGKAVEVAESEQLERGGDGTHQDVLGGRLAAELVALVPCGKRIHRDGRHFEPEEEREQVAGGNDGESTEGRKRDGADEFGNLVHLSFLAAVLEVVLR